MHSIIKAKTVVIEDLPERGISHAGAHPVAGPRVELVRVGGRVMAVELSCECGDVHVIELDYADGVDAGATAPLAPTAQEAA